MLKRLSSVTGTVQSDSVSGSADKLVRRAILVHEGEFQASTGPISFSEGDLQTLVQNHNRMIQVLAAEYGGENSMPLGAYPPILADHDDDKTLQICGRLASLLTFEKRDIPKVGKDIPCVTADITFLGEDTVNRVNDGRIYHLSIGVDDVTMTLGELSVVVDPAAPGAMLLKKSKVQKSKLKSSGGDKKMANKEIAKKRLSKLSELKSILEKSNSKLSAAKEEVKLSAAKTQVKVKLSGLMKAGKMSPAEYKSFVEKAGLKKLAKMGKANLEIALLAFESREMPVIDPRQFGSTSAAEFSSIAKNLEKKQKNQLNSEFKASLKKLGVKKFSEESEEEKKEAPKKMGIDEKIEENKKAMADSNSDEKNSIMSPEIDEPAMSEEDEKKGMDDLQAQVDELSTQLARMAGIVSELMEGNSEEDESKLEDDSDSEGDSEEDSEMSEEEDSKEKNLQEDDKEKEEKLGEKKDSDSEKEEEEK